jgi:hypothetical protein
MYEATALKALLTNDNGFAFDPSTGHTYNLSLSALNIVRLLNGGADEEAVLEQLMATYEVTERRAVHDIDSFLATLCQYGLLAAKKQGGGCQ